MKKILIPALVFATVFACKQPQKEAKSEVSEIQQEEKQEITQPNPEWTYLFDGTSFKGWHIYNGGEVTDTTPWKIAYSAMVFDGRKEGPEYNLVTDKEYTDFKLSLEWKISEGGNSGVMWGVKEEEKYAQPYLTGPEIQVLDNEKHPDGKYPSHHAGALYDMIAPPENITNPVGEWNKYEIYINHKTNEGKVWLNGTLTAQFPLEGEEWATLIANSKFKDWEGFGKSKTGKICLQDHEDKVWYKNIKIQEL
ncbi:3-keto-disaccharide hydrolase [Abyssalbus ytuae]|uniref:DUF1080 domain-containing protein n=1 Tax=Abyssalbus ytuae TaxID=2926907 RepID=A0A9E6ZWS0_9FLAO|nr:DUF1080 domain-containing protein [Abyssalbus ytuae]UOB19183.1 DUF1080 domain-containing protein [Abyssalbus ytuae]